MSHTPGPWSFSTEPQPNGCQIVGHKGLMVAMLAHTVNQDDQREIALANARLIAAAPRMLHELYAAASQIEALGGDASTQRSVIAAATTAASLT